MSLHRLQVPFVRTLTETAGAWEADSHATPTRMAPSVGTASVRIAGSAELAAPSGAPRDPSTSSVIATLRIWGVTGGGEATAGGAARTVTLSRTDTASGSAFSCRRRTRVHRPPTRCLPVDPRALSSTVPDMTGVTSVTRHSLSLKAEVLYAPVRGPVGRSAEPTRLTPRPPRRIQRRSCRNRGRAGSTSAASVSS